MIPHSELVKELVAQLEDADDDTEVAVFLDTEPMQELVLTDVRMEDGTLKVTVAPW